MSISSISSIGAAAAAVAYPSNQTAAVTAQTSASQSASQTSNSQTTVTLSAAAAAAQGVPAAANTGAFSVAMFKSSAAAQNSIIIYSIGAQKANAAMTSFNNDWADAKQSIAAQRPDLLDQKWDIVTDQGTIQVISNTLSEGDKAWLIGILNQNKNLVADTQNINAIAVNTFSGTAAMAAEDTLGMTLTSLNQHNIDGKIHFLGLLGELNLQLIPTSSVGQITQLCAPGQQRDALAAAFYNFLQPAFASTSVQDGTNILAGQNIDTQGLTANELSTVTKKAVELMNALTNGSAEGDSILGGIDPQFLNWAEQSVSSVLGANYRTYGEGAAAADVSNSSSSNISVQGAAAAGKVQSSATTTVAPDANVDSSANSPGPTANAADIKNIYEETGADLSDVEAALSSSMKEIGSDWNAVKSLIAAQQLRLLSQNHRLVYQPGIYPMTRVGLITQSANSNARAE